MGDHRGVWILNPAGRHGYRLKYRDSETGRFTKKTLKGPRFQGDTKAAARAREDAAVRKHNELLRREIQLEDGAPKRKKVPLRDAEQRFLGSRETDRTVQTHSEGTRLLIAWAARNGLRSTDDITRGTLMEFREHLGTFDVAGATHDKRLRAVKAMVAYWIDAQLCARVTYEDLRRLKLKNEPVEPRVWLTPTQCRKVLEATMRHDTESAGQREPIAAFVLYVLLSGARAAEALALDWSHVDLDALDVNGEPTGQVEVPAAIAKMKKRRVIGLRETPALRRLLAALRLRSGDTTGPVWGFSNQVAHRTRWRAINDFGSPTFDLQQLRVTADCYLNNSPGIYGGAAAFMAAQRLGHSVAISEKFYTSQIHGIKPELHTLEEVLGITKQCDQVIRSVTDASRDRASVSRIGESRKS